MRRYIAEGRSTLGASQKNEAEMSVDKVSPGKGNKGRKGKKSKEEVALALNPDFD